MLIANHPMTISVIIPIYKVELYVRKCIESILNQENCGASIECVVVDDCTPDDSMSVVHSLVDEYKGTIRFVFMKHDRNRGLSAARNTGIEAATGDYILFVDSDDWLPVDALSKFVNALQRYPDLDMVWGNHYCRDAEALFYETNKEIFYDNYHARKFLVFCIEGACNAWNKLVRTDIVKRNRFKEGIINEDQPWTYFLFKEINRVLQIPDNTYVYENNNPTSIIHTSKNKENIPRLVKSEIYTCNAILDAPYKDLFAGTVFYFWRCYFVAFRLQYEYELGEDECRQLRQLRSRILKSSIKKGRLFMALFVFLLTYPPTSYLFDIKWVRWHYNMIAKTGRSIAFFLEKFHK